ncbi:PREDICTED: succinate dehydrogenase [ubiquinone] cytochrome b small subunit, mitochondrial-like [Nicrophorus vespilloides]|uniref:Succinate dehydrogenase [ubiquinone] cytochrome b small subunit n=1 Tax=Nicrophorus vespilloides TaxID=110193 RepID=A0ABM1M0X2_NICVS|nr:PREDICTED: succinate dehydrogenase [ubiquinone] cytochrome b small subunit, mitochondrial-like [Nicrophorus vespilloides]
MALSLIVKSAAKPQIMQNLLRHPSSLQFSQLTQQSQKGLNLTKKCTNFMKANRTLFVSAPLRSAAKGDHTKLWTMEKALSASLLGIVPAAIMMPNPILDNLLATAVVIHFHWGLEACVVDYVRAILFGAAAPKLALGGLYLVSFLTLGGLLYFNYHDIGLGKAIRKIWALKPNN